MTRKGIHGAAWTRDEELVLRASYEELGPLETSKLLPKRTMASVQQHASKLGICRRQIRTADGTFLTRKFKTEYTIWSAMIQRCTNPKNKRYSSYGGRGISVAIEWLGNGGFSRFIEHIGPRPSRLYSLERPNVNGSYVPGNVIWATQDVQDRNKRNNIWLTHNGRTQIASDWARELGIDGPVISYRLSRGWTTSEALEAPPDSTLSFETFVFARAVAGALKAIRAGDIESAIALLERSMKRASEYKGSRRGKSDTRVTDLAEWAKATSA